MPASSSQAPPAAPYTVLARRYRSRTFDEVVGQEHVARTLKRAIETGRVHHAYLFCGTRGVGKTSMARILAVALNDPTTDRPSPQPDPDTDVARAIFRGEDVDVIEIDAASNTGVENVRDLIENARFRPMRSRFKVYIIDEVHMLSKAAFNALLKIMEEPPEHVKFILATTEPEKVLATIISRVQRFDFRNIPAAEIARHLREVCEREKVEADEDALLQVARNGAGSMRDALSLLDRLISAAEGRLTAAMVNELLGLPPAERVFELIEAIGQGDVAATLERAEEIIAAGQSPDTLIGAMIDHLHALLIRGVMGSGSTAGGGGAGAEVAELPGVDPQRVTEQAGKLEPAVISQDIAILEELRRQMKSSGAGRALVDATLVRLALAGQFTPVAALLEGGVKGEVVAAAGGRTGGAGGGSDAGKKGLRPVADLARDGAEGADAAEPPPASGGTRASAENVAPVAVRSGHVQLGDLASLWAGLHRAISEQHATLAPLLEGGHIERLDLPQAPAPGQDAAGSPPARQVGVVEIVFPSDRGPFVSMLERNGKKEVVARTLQEMLSWQSEPLVRLRLLEADALPSTPPPLTSRESAKRHTDSADPGPGQPSGHSPAGFDFSNDPLITAALRELGARVVKVEDVK